MKTEKKVINLMLKENSDLTIRQISNKLGSDYKITHTAVKRLFKKQILTSKTVGKSILCSLNRWSNNLILAECERSLEVSKDILLLKKEIYSKSSTSFFIMLLFGSYAKGQANKHSDIDIIFISNEKDFEINTRKTLRLLPLKVHPLFFTEKEFVNMINSRESNVAKEAINNYVILYGIENLYNLMQK